VILEDPNKNQIQVSIEKKNAKIYFARGWTRLRHFYRLGSGGWVTLLYINPTLFQIKVWKITGIEIAYPQADPPHRLMLHEQSSECFTNGPVPYYESPAKFMHTLEKTLSPTDVGSGVLVSYFSHTIYHFSYIWGLILLQNYDEQKLSWNGFCKIALPNENTELTMVDWFGYSWKCHFEIEGCPPNNCKITGEWRSFCRARRLSDGVTLKFGVTEYSNNNVVHLKISPFIGVRTTLIAPTTSEDQKPFYQAEHCFLL
jgi:hypothetical protein